MKDFLLAPRLYIMILAIFALSCESENEEPVIKPIADFTFEADATNSLITVFTNTSGDYGEYETASWDFGDGSGVSQEDSPVYTYDKAGVYKVTLTVGRGGFSDDISKEVTVEAPDPVDEGPGDGEPDEENPEGNLIAGGNMEDEAAWNFYNGGFDEVTQYEFASGNLIFTNGTGGVQSNVVVWQAIEVEAGKEYLFSANVSSTTGGSNSWLQVYFGTEIPEEGKDYNYPEKSYTGIITYSGCGKEPFEGDLAELGCHGDSAGTGAGGSVMFDESGTIYFVMKVGSYDGSLGDGFVVHNVSLVEAD